MLLPGIPTKSPRGRLPHLLSPVVEKQSHDSDGDKRPQMLTAGPVADPSFLSVGRTKGNARLHRTGS